jgi:hypothetical protein
MFIGHFALAYAAKRIEPEVSLGTSMEAGQLADIVWPYFLLAGVEAVGRWGALSLAVVLFAIYLASALGPPPPSPRAVALATAPGFLFAFWAAWADRHRATVR